jgi:hypothetical protein
MSPLWTLSIVGPRPMKYQYLCSSPSSKWYFSVTACRQNWSQPRPTILATGSCGMTLKRMKTTIVRIQRTNAILMMRRMM